MNKALKPSEEWLAQFREEKCSECPFNPGNRPTPTVMGEGGDVDDVEIVFVGEAPGAVEDECGRPFTGRAGMLLRGTLTKMNVPSRSAFITNVVKCRPPENKTPSQKECEHCASYLEWELSQFPKHVPIVTLGKVATNHLLGRRERISNLRGGAFKVGGRTVCPTWHPAAVLRDPHKGKELYMDLANARTGANKEPLPSATQYYEHQAFDRLSLHLADKKGMPLLILDIETSGGKGKGGLSPYRVDSRIVVLGVKLAGVNETYHFTTATSIRKFCEALENFKVGLVGHNIKFDLLWLVAAGFLLPNALFNVRIWDTMVNYAAIDENAPTKGLKQLCMALFNVPDWSIDFENYKPSELMTYNSIDLCMTERLFDWEKQQSVHWRLMEEGTAVTVMLEHAGIMVDMSELEQLKVEYLDRIDRVLRRMQSSHGESFNPLSPKQVGKVLFEDLKLPIYIKTPKGVPSTCEEAILRLKEHGLGGAFLDDLLQFREDKKIVGTYIQAFYDFLSSHAPSHRFFLHPKYEIAKHQYGGTVTGRLASNGPNMQNQPPVMMRTFTSRFPGGKLLKPDLSQIELRMLAHESGDPELCRIFREGDDLHDEVVREIVAPRLPDLPPEIQRTVAKRVNFGIAYKISSYGLVRLMPDLDEKAARGIIRAWYKRFSGVREWQGKVQLDVLRDAEVTSMFGRVRHLPGGDSSTKEGREILRQGVNFPIQSAAADLMTYGIMPGIMKKMLDMGLKSLLIANIHDALIFDVHPDEEEAVRTLIDDFFTNPPLPPLPPTGVVGIKPLRWNDFSDVPLKYKYEPLKKEEKDEYIERVPEVQGQNT